MYIFIFFSPYFSPSSFLIIFFLFVLFFRMNVCVNAMRLLDLAEICNLYECDEKRLFVFVYYSLSLQCIFGRLFFSLCAWQMGKLVSRSFTYPGNLSQKFKAIEVAYIKCQNCGNVTEHTSMVKLSSFCGKFHSLNFV